MRRLALVLVALLTLTGFAAADPTWVEVRSPHFTVTTDAGEKRGREVAMEFEQMRALFGKFLHRDQVNSSLPLQILALRSNKELRQFSPLWKGKPVELSGYYQSGEDCNYILLDLSADNYREVVLHEYAHLLLNGNFRPTPTWFDEGFAEYFASVQFESGKAKIGMAPTGDVDTLQSVQLMPTAILLKVTQDSNYYNESGDRRSMFYAQSWLMVHYLMDKNRLEQFETYRHLAVDLHQAPEASFQQAFGTDTKSFDKVIDRFLHSTEFQILTGPLPFAKELPMTARPLSDGERASLFAEVHYHLRDYQDKALAEFQAILQTDPKNARAHRGLGYIYLRKQQLEDAGREFGLSAELDSQDPRVHYFSALLGQMVGSLDQDRTAGMRQHLEKAIALDPQYADAYHLLAFVHLTQREYDGCLTAEQRAVQLSPRNEDFRMGLGSCLIPMKRFDEAQQIYTDLSHSGSPRVASEAASMLEQIERMRAYEKEMVQVPTPPVPPAPTNVASNAVPLPSHSDTPNTVATTPPPTRAVHSVQFLKGKLVKVDCSQPPGAVLEVQAQNVVWHITAPDAAHALTIGADSLSCSWVNKAVSVNFYPGDGNTGKLLSLELSSGK